MHQEGSIVVDAAPKVTAQAFVRRLLSLHAFHPAELAELAGLIEDASVVPAKHHILKDRQPVDHAFVLLEGLACCCSYLSAGRRQMTGFVVPGDFCDYGFLSSSPVAQSVVSLGRAVVGRIRLSRLSAMGDRRPNIVVAIMRAAAIDRACGRQLAVSLGGRDAIQRIGHFLCEMHERMRTVGLVDGTGRFQLPMTQSDLGDALGLSTVHVNRTIQQLRRQELISMSQGTITIRDLPALRALSSFDPRYLTPG